VLFSVDPLHLPVAVPNLFQRLARSCQSGAGAIEAFGVIEVSSADIAERKVGQIEVLDVPVGVIPLAAAYGLAKKRKLVAKLVSVRRRQVAGVIPPLGSVVGMIEIITRELVLVSRNRQLILRRRGHGKKQ